MFKTIDIEQRFGAVEQAIGQARLACMGDRGVSGDVRASVERLTREAARARELIAAQDDKRIRNGIDALLQLADQARRACQFDPDTDVSVRRGVDAAHQALAALHYALLSEPGSPF